MQPSTHSSDSLAMNLPEKIYSEDQLQAAKGRAKVVGWAQGAGVVIGAGVLWNLLGWIPIAIGIGGVGWVAWKVMSGSSDDEAE